jgi:methyltransferase (TIGR00027 family)
MGAAAHRAAHQVLEEGRIFSDPLALRILGPEGEEAVKRVSEDPARRGLRLFIAVRTRFAEDALAAAVRRDARQLVILGAGLDTTAYRTEFPAGFRVFEVDHAATQAWKRQRLAEAGIAAPVALTFAPVDFERETLADGLGAAGFDAARRTFFTLLGVVPYLTETAVYSTLSYIGALPGGSDVVFDYGNPPDARDESEEHTAAREALTARVAAAGESFKSFYDTPTLHERLRALGFAAIEDLGPREIRERWFAGRGSTRSDRGGHILHASAAPNGV